MIFDLCEITTQEPIYMHTHTLKIWGYPEHQDTSTAQCVEWMGDFRDVKFCILCAFSFVDQLYFYIGTAKVVGQ